MNVVFFFGYSHKRCLTNQKIKLYANFYNTSILVHSQPPKQITNYIS